MIFEVIDLGNNNALIALAYIRENNNPLIVFCNYITYCLSVTPNYILRHDELMNKIKDEFGLILPNHMLKICIRILKKEKKVEKLRNGSGYKLIDFSFNIEDFNRKRDLLKNKEDDLVDGLIKFVKKFDKDWTNVQAREQLTNFLVELENAYNLFATGSIETINNNCLPNEWYVGRYVTNLLEDKNASTNYLIDIVNGLMIYIGVYQTQDYLQEKNKKFRGTDFYIDTKLLLRAMGFSWTLEVNATKELIELIIAEYGGNICVFEHTIGEIESALFNAADALKRGGKIYDCELSTFAYLNKCNDYDFELYSKTVRMKIEKELNFKIKPSSDWNDLNTRKHNLDWDKLCDFIKTRHPSWKDRAIKNDMSSINNINILRKGDYSVNYGGKKRLPIFITSNSILVKDVKDYVLQHGEDDTGTANWNISSLPIITDNMLMCRLWVPKATCLTSIPILTLSRNAYAAQQASIPFLEKLKTTMLDIKGKHNVNIIDISDVRKSKLEEILIKNTCGDLEELTPEVMATSLDELINLETMNLNKSINNLQEDKEKDALTISRQEQQIIISACERYKNKIGIRRIILYIAQSWWIITSLFFGVMSIYFYQLNQSKTICIYPLISLAIKLLEKIFNRPIITDLLLKKSVNLVWEEYSNRISRTLIGIEKDYEISILKNCIAQSQLFDNYQGYIKDKIEDYEKNVTCVNQI